MPDGLPADDPADFLVDEDTGEILDDAEDGEADLAGWVWEAMEPPVRRERLVELRTWVHWLVRTYPWTHSHVTPCWYRHRDVREHLTALFVSWVRTYTPGSKRDTAEVEWIDALYRTMPRLALKECGPQQHVEQRPRDFKDTDHGFLVHSKTSDDMTAEARHPAIAELIRQGVEQ
ncbi:hypothetical protein ABT354_19855 [Streptomyces sp. NPDC000594]|uniref:hypothetical protein n=1 Tax=Streptomyces sp. NPDC000594 TaxID=3154261 RepID=UPI0033311F54